MAARFYMLTGYCQKTRKYLEMHFAQQESDKGSTTDRHRYQFRPGAGPMLGSSLVALLQENGYQHL